ncbi:geranylgeranylglycerol-phosphate geranylgeranyltransferase [Capnocytophaga canimorsus]|uniref:Uncharacterized protein n=2 Tax=Capnocytophaga canimorsus TaxID=28188 RepID=A0AAC9Z393_9FLAO|nr:geranylgeranylglycerol-phosphate geranylgeranyltransferase [Capnocytophaga canimorsus]AEK23713.1 Conserved putative Geranylgeranylglycerol-phosphate geranylgeranyltransferase [Capnocytophaga canimorsus Cc5]ATA93436.1 hypothetical protein CGC54_03335 [Capnocytophaga canimorsus]
MKFIRKLLDFYLKSSLHVALALTAMGFISLRELTSNNHYVLLPQLFFLGIVAYNFVKYIPFILKNNKSFSKKLKIIILTSCFLSCYLLFYFTSAPVKEKQILSLTILLTLAYTFPILPYKSSLRQLIGIKTVSVALCWTLISVILPIIHTKISLNLNVYTAITQRFLLVFVLILPFDIQDIKESESGNIPKKIGILNTKRLGTFILTLYTFLFYFRTYPSPIWYWANLSIVLLTAILLWLTPAKSNHQLHSTFLVESIPIVYGLWIFFFSN